MNDRLIETAEQLRRELSQIELTCREVSSVYNPLDYAWEQYREYLRQFGRPPKRVVFVGMNPGPWGMAQTGIPFGEIHTVTHWLGLCRPVRRPRGEHPAKPVMGLSCTRSEVSGKRLWGLIRQRFSAPADFAEEHFIANYCPLLFLDEAGRNLTPVKLPAVDQKALFQVCDRHLLSLLEVLQPQFVIGIGRFAEKRCNQVVLGSSLSPLPKIVFLLHPSPANPKANRGWAQVAEETLTKAGVWKTQ